MMGSVGYLDNGASFHMTSNKDLFSNLEENDLQMHIKMGDDKMKTKFSLNLSLL